MRLGEILGLIAVGLTVLIWIAIYLLEKRAKKKQREIDIMRANYHRKYTEWGGMTFDDLTDGEGGVKR